MITRINSDGDDEKRKGWDQVLQLCLFENSLSSFFWKFAKTYLYLEKWEKNRKHKKNKVLKSCIWKLKAKNWYQTNT